MNTNDFFISHATADRELVSELVDFMESALKIDRSKIYCTSGTGTRKMRTGNNFIENIKENVKGTKVVIFIFTPNYFKSNFCLAELGAAWALSSEVYPIIIPPTPRKLLKSTPLSESTQALTLNTYEDLITMADEFKEMDVAEYRSVKVLNERAHKLIDWIKENCSFDIEESVSKAEHSAVQEQLEGLKIENHAKQLEIIQLTTQYEHTLKAVREENAKIKNDIDVFRMEKETTDGWELLEECVKKVKRNVTPLNDLVTSAIYYDEFHQGTKFWPVKDIIFDWGQVKQLESENMIRVDRDDMRITPNYDEYSVRQAVDLLHELLRYISSNINEKMKQEFKAVQKFHLDFYSKDFWHKILYVYIYDI
ncbi:TIR domain-containing protein [Bacillus mycoides]|uniref:toll/interleukin-1 receptor domain-containing protein n=1 Tax=Bacillus mycoides TaxID=1405 RepID=UPI0022B2CD2C|nr:toll/interleukin-1 receptor domain-containing protein [Bacillus mycoides]MCZ6942586.1 TIR domain-containing protein [Bacillus mycoides]